MTDINMQFSSSCASCIYNNSEFGIPGQYSRYVNNYLIYTAAETCTYIYRRPIMYYATYYGMVWYCDLYKAGSILIFPVEIVLICIIGSSVPCKRMRLMQYTYYYYVTA